MKRQAKQLLWLDEPRGVYIPRDFALSFRDRDMAVKGADADTWAILESGPEHESYWEAWDDVCRDAEVMDTDGTVYTVWQDGACWLVEKGAEWDETGKISETGWYMDDGESDGTVTYTAPSAWASYLINGDASGLEEGEQAQCDAWVESVGLGSPVSCEDAGFIHYHDAYNAMPFAADCQRYTFYTREG